MEPDPKFQLQLCKQRWQRKGGRVFCALLAGFIRLFDYYQGWYKSQ